MDKPASDKLVPVAEGGDIGAFSSDAAGRIGKDLGDAAIGVHTLPGQTRTVEIQVGLKAMLRRARAALPSPSRRSQSISILANSLKRSSLGNIKIPSIHPGLALVTRRTSLLTVNLF